MVDFETLVTYTLNGVVLGSIIALAAIGLTLVYGILNLSNFAHGDFLTLGAYGTFFFNVFISADEALTWAFAVGLVLLGAPFVDLVWPRRLDRMERGVLMAMGALTLLVALAQLAGPDAPIPTALTQQFTLAALLGILLVPAVAVALDFAVWRPLRRKRATVLTLIIVSIGIALALRHLLAYKFGTALHNYDRPVQPPYFFGNYTVTEAQALALVTSAILILGVHLLLRYTRVGKALRALSDNVDLARVTGIDVDRMILYVWIIGGALAGIAGILLAMIVNVNTNLGWNLILPTFAAVILGGIGSPYGALAGAMVIAIAMQVSVAWIPEYSFAVGFVILILVLLFRPQGIFGGAKA